MQVLQERKEMTLDQKITEILRQYQRRCNVANGTAAKEIKLAVLEEIEDLYYHGNDDDDLYPLVELNAIRKLLK